QGELWDVPHQEVGRRQEGQVTGREDSIMLRTPVGGLVVLALTAPVSAAPLPPPPGLPQRLAWADCVVVGKVESIEEKTVKAPRGRGDKEEVEFQVAVIKIDDAFVARHRQEWLGSDAPAHS